VKWPGPSFFESGWDQLHASGNNLVWDNITLYFGKDTSIRKIPPPLLSHLSKDQVEKSKKCHKAQASKGKISMASFLSYAQATSWAKTLLKIKEAFPALLDNKIIKIYNAVISKLANREKRKIQLTTKSSSRKRAIVPVSDKFINTIIGEANFYIFQINILLKNIKSALKAKFIWPCPRGISINTNNIPSSSDLTIMECYLRSVVGTNNNKILAPCLLQSKSYLKIIGIPYLQSSGNKLTTDDVTNFMSHTELFEFIFLGAKPRIIKILPKSDIVIVWFDIWDSQNSSKAKLLINYSFNFGKYIATIRATNMNLGVFQCYNCWKWGHLTFSYCAHGSRCQKYNRPHKLKHHYDMAWYYKANPKINPPRLETTQGLLCSHTFKCVNYKGKHIADDNKYLFWKYRFNHKWHSKKAQETRKTRANSIHLVVGGNKVWLNTT